MNTRLLIFGLIIVIVLVDPFDLLKIKFIPSNVVRQTPHGPVLRRSCSIYGGRFYGFGGKCDGPITWPDVLIGGGFVLFIYTALYR
jgi:hypothetical protein